MSYLESSTCLPTLAIRARRFSSNKGGVSQLPHQKFVVRDPEKGLGTSHPVRVEPQRVYLQNG